MDFDEAGDTRGVQVTSPHTVGTWESGPDVSGTCQRGAKEPISAVGAKPRLDLHRDIFS